MKVLICDPISEQGIEILQGAEGVQVDVKLKQSEEEIMAIIDQYDACVVRSETKITKNIMDKAINLKIIGRAGVGVDNIDVEAATMKGIIVVNAPEGNTFAAAELTVAHILSLSRNIPQANQVLKSGTWARSKFSGKEVRGKILGVVGLGKIGAEVAKRARAFDMTVYAYDPFVSEERAKNLGVELKTLDEIIAESDFITVHMPLNKDTRNMFAKEQFDRMKDGARIINVARGGIINEADLYEAVKSGKLGGAAIDVFEKEPCTDSPLFELENVIVTPHLGASTAEAQINVAIDVAVEIVHCLQGEVVRNAVNIPSIKPEQMKIMQPYLQLVEKLGRFIGQVVDENIKSIEVSYNGDLANHNVGPLTTGIVKEILQPTLQETVNYVNAPIVAKSRGIKILEKKSVDIEDYANLISVTVETAKGKTSVAGTSLQNSNTRMVRVDDFPIDIALSGIEHLLVMPHKDRPGIIGRTGTLMGEHNINIAGMMLGRKEKGGEAIAVLTIDATAPQSVIDELKKMDGVQDVRYVAL